MNKHDRLDNTPLDEAKRSGKQEVVEYAYLLTTPHFFFSYLKSVGATSSHTHVLFDDVSKLIKASRDGNCNFCTAIHNNRAIRICQGLD